MKDYHYILGVPKTATKKEIKAAYRKLSKKFHPDLNEGDKFFEDRFKDINEAYETLLNDGAYSTTTSSEPSTTSEDTNGNNIEYPVIKQFYANKKTVFVNDPIKIVWSTEHCNLVRLNIMGEVDLSGHKNLKFKKPNANLVIELVASNQLNEKVAQRLTIQIIKDTSETTSEPSTNPVDQSQNDQSTDEDEDAIIRPQKSNKTNKKSSNNLVFIAVTAMLLGAAFLFKDIIASTFNRAQSTTSQLTTPPTPSANETADSDKLEETKKIKEENKPPVYSLKNSFCIGSSRNKVIAVQGAPSEINKIGADELLYYGQSSITIQDGKVIEYSNSSKNLKVRFKTSPSKSKSNNLFAIGDSRQTVLDLQGTPTKVKWDAPYETFHYGYSTITLKEAVIVDYSNSDNNLKAKLK